MRWQVFIGMWGDDDGPDWERPNFASDSYRDARRLMVSRLAAVAKDGCGSCRDQASEELARLCARPADTEFTGWVNGEEYLLIRSDWIEDEPIGGGVVTAPNPGPWAVVTELDEEGAVYVWDADGRRLCVVNFSVGDMAERLRVAERIVAAVNAAAVAS